MEANGGNGQAGHLAARHSRAPDGIAEPIPLAEHELAPEPEPEPRSESEPPTVDQREPDRAPAAMTAERPTPGSLADLRQRLHRLPYGPPSPPYPPPAHPHPPPPPPHPPHPPPP